MSAKKYLVSLENANERRKNLQVRLGATFNNISVITAIDGRKLPASEYFKYLKQARYFLSPSELGCTLSHIHIYESAIISGEKSIIILEDDAIIDSDDLNRCDEVARRMPSNSICILGGQEGLTSRKWLIGRAAPNLGLNVYEVPKICWGQIWRTCSYAVGNDALHILLKQQQDGISKADDWSYLCKDGIRVFYIELVRHPVELSDSSIEIERLNIHNERITEGIITKILSKAHSLYVKKYIYAKIIISILYLTIGFSFIPRRQD